VAGYEGVFLHVCEASLAVLRGNKELLLSALESFVHDPLVEWQRSKAGKASAAAETGAGSTVGAHEDMSTAKGGEAENPDGLRMLRRVRERLEGEYNNGLEYVREMSRLKERGGGGGAPGPASNALEVRGQVHRLLKEATCDENLSVMYIGWMPFL
jgi:phosphatidylinositol kinase/protein kinase (PI-3  family)